MIDPGMMGAPLPPEGAMGAAPAAGPMPAPISPVEAVVMALQNMQAERGMENDALMQAVLKATGGMPSGLEGVSEGAPMGVPAGHVPPAAHGAGEAGEYPLG